MHDYFFPIEVVRFAFVAGVIVSMYLYERRHLTTGSIVVPGYVAVFMLMPSVILATILNAALSYLVVNKVIMKWVLLYGRVKIIVLAMISIALQSLMLKVSPSGPWLWEADVPYFVGIGYVVPALIAHDMARQGIAQTAKSVMLAAGLVILPILLAIGLHVDGVTDLSGIRPAAQTHLASGWIPLAILFSAMAAWAVANNYGFRSGGFVGSALLSVFAVNRWQVLFIVLVALVTHHLVARVLMHRLILFGRRKFASMLMLSSAIVWSLVLAGERLMPLPMQAHLGITSLALTPLFLPGLLANDMERSSVRRVFAGTSMASAFVLSSTWTIRSLTLGRGPLLIPGAVAVAMTGVIFHPQIRSLARVAVRAGGRTLGRGATQLRPSLGALGNLASGTFTGATLVAAGDGPAPHAARPARRREEAATPAPGGAWLAGRHDVRVAAADRPPKHSAGPDGLGYRPRHLASGASARSHGRRAATPRPA